MSQAMDLDCDNGDNSPGGGAPIQDAIEEFEEFLRNFQNSRSAEEEEEVENEEDEPLNSDARELQQLLNSSPSHHPLCSSSIFPAELDQEDCLLLEQLLQASLPQQEEDEPCESRGQEELLFSRSSSWGQDERRFGSYSPISSSEGDWEDDWEEDEEEGGSHPGSCGGGYREENVWEPKMRGSSGGGGFNNTEGSNSPPLLPSGSNNFGANKLSYGMHGSWEEHPGGNPEFDEEEEEEEYLEEGEIRDDDRIYNHQYIQITHLMKTVPASSFIPFVYKCTHFPHLQTLINPNM